MKTPAPDSSDPLDAWLRAAARAALEKGHSPARPPPELLDKSRHALLAPSVLPLLSALASPPWIEAAEAARQARTELDRGDWPMAAQVCELATRLPALLRAEKRHPAMRAHLQAEMRAVQDVLSTMRTPLGEADALRSIELLGRRVQLDRIAQETRKELGEGDQRSAACVSLATELERLHELAGAVEADSIQRSAESALREVLAEVVQLAAERRDWMAVAQARSRYLRAWRKSPAGAGIPDLSHDPPEWTLVQCAMIGEAVGDMHARGIVHGTLLLESFAWNASVRNFGRTDMRPDLDVTTMAEDLRLMRPQLTDRQWGAFAEGYLKIGDPMPLELAQVHFERDAVPGNPLLVTDFEMPHFVVRACGYALRNFDEVKVDLAAALAQAQSETDLPRRLQALAAFAAEHADTAADLADLAVRQFLSELRRELDRGRADIVATATASALDELPGTLTRTQELTLKSLAFEAQALLASDPEAAASAWTDAGTLLLRASNRSFGAQGLRLMAAALDASSDPRHRAEISVALLHPLLERASGGMGSAEIAQALRLLPQLEDFPAAEQARLGAYLHLCRAALSNESALAAEALALARREVSHLTDGGELKRLLDRLRPTDAVRPADDLEAYLDPSLREIVPPGADLIHRGDYYRAIQLLKPALDDAEERKAGPEICLPIVGTLAVALHQLADFEPARRRDIAAWMAILLDRYTKDILAFATEGQGRDTIGASVASNLGLLSVSLNESAPDPRQALAEGEALLERAVALWPRVKDPGKFSCYANNLALGFRARASHEDRTGAVALLRRAEGLLREVIAVDESFQHSSDRCERSLAEQRDVDEFNLGLTALDLARATDDATWISKRPLESAGWYRAAAMAFTRAKKFALAVQEHARQGTADGNLARVLLDICKHHVRHLHWAGGDVKREFYDWLCEFAGEPVSTRMLRERCASRALGAAMRSARVGLERNASLLRESIELMAELWSLADVHQGVASRLALHILMSILETLESALQNSAAAVHLTERDELTDFRCLLESVLRVEMFRLGLAGTAELSVAHASFAQLTRSSSAVLRALARPRSRWLEVEAHVDGVSVNGLYMGCSPQGLEVRIPAQHRRLVFRGVAVQACYAQIESLTLLQGETARSVARITPNLDWNDVPATVAVACAEADGWVVMALRLPVPSWDVWTLRWLSRGEGEGEIEIDLPWIGALDCTTNRIEPSLPATMEDNARRLLFGESGLLLEIALPPAEEGAGRLIALPAGRGIRVRFSTSGFLMVLKATPRIAGSDVAYVVKDDHPLAALCCAASFPLDLPGATLVQEALRSFAPLLPYAGAVPREALEYLNQRDLHEIVLVGLPDDAGACDAALRALFDPRREIFLLVEEVETPSALAAVARLREHLRSEVGSALLGLASSAIHVIEPLSGIQVITSPRELAGAATQMLLDLAAIRRRPMTGIPVLIDGRETYVDIVGNEVGPLRNATLLPTPSTWRDLALLYIRRRDEPLGKAVLTSKADLGEALRLAMPQIAQRSCAFLPEALTAVLACVPWVRHRGAIPIPRTEAGRTLAGMLGHTADSEEFPAEAAEIATRFQAIVTLDHDRFLAKLAPEASVFASSLALFREMAPAEYLVLCTVGPDECAWGYIAANYAGALGAPLLPMGAEVLKGAADLIAAGSAIISGPGLENSDYDEDSDGPRAFMLARKIQRLPEMTNAAIEKVIALIETLHPRFVGFVSAHAGFPLELVGSPPLATRFALGRLAGPDLLSTSLLVARAALSEDVVRPPTLSVFLAEASDVPGHPPLMGAAKEVAELAEMLKEDTALLLDRTGRTEADLEQFAAALTRAHLLHFAGHGFYDKDDPLRSGLVFRGGRFVARDVPLSLAGAPLIFGNACESASLAAGSTAAHPGWSGLAASLIAAGANNYVGSLWPVFDHSSQRLAEEFYRQLLRGDGVGEALQKARHACYKRGDRRDPTWAAFVLFGCPRNRFRPRNLSPMTPA